MVKQYEIYWADLNPTKGSEINKKRPCLVISPNEMNLPLNTIIIAPLTSVKKVNYPMRINVKINNKTGSIALDQIRTIDKSRLIKKIGMLDSIHIKKVKYLIYEMLIK